MNNKEKAKEILTRVKKVVFDPKKYRYYAAVVVLCLIALILVKCTDGTASDSDPMAGAYQKYDTVTEKSNKELYKLINSYYTAYAKGDVKTLKKIAKPFSEKEASYVDFFKQYAEGYKNIEIYSKRGITKDAYLVSSKMEVKFKNIKATAPGLDFFYVETDKNGKLYINNKYSNFNTNNSEYELDSKIVKLIATFESQDDVQKLQTEVQKKFNDIMVKDAELNTFLTSTLDSANSTWSSNYDSEASKKEEAKKAEKAQKEAEKKAKADEKKKAKEQDKADKEAKAKAAKQAKADEKNKKTKYVTKTLSVYDKADTSGTVLGNLEVGAEVTMYAEEGNWARILYNNNHNAYVDKNLLADQKPSGTDTVDVAGLTPNSKFTLKTSVRVREGMDETSSVLAVVYKNEPVTIVANYASGWTKVVTKDNQTGYIKTELLQ